LLDGRYRVVRHLGSGGMASVQLCQDERLGRLVAVKRLHADSPEEVEQRFVREAKLGASLNHPNLVAVYDTAIDDEGVLIVMEYVQGEPLSRALREGPLGPRRVGTMASEIGEALDHAHEQGVIHRDVKPGNVLLRNDGVAKLVDLGIATAADGTRITRSGTVLGTAAYMAPEQLEGREPGPAVDIYALAAVCFESLSGHKPRGGTTPLQIAHSIASEPPPDLREHWRAAPAPVAELLAQGMARDPDERPRSAGELGAGLARALEEPAEPVTEPTRRVRWAAPPPSSPTASRPATAPRPGGGARPPGRSRRLPVIVAALILALAVAVAAASLTSGRGDDDSSGNNAGSGTGGDAGSSKKQKAKKRNDQGEAQPAQTTPAPAPEPTEPTPTEPDAVEPAEDASGAELNQQGFTLLNAARYDEAIPVLQQAVESFPEGTTDLNYAYSLFNLGKALRLAGRPAEAIPILEQRLQIPNQTGVVRKELALARQAAGE
jgi:eukaryotic-like serine/threonine-protein kinase